MRPTARLAKPHRGTSMGQREQGGNQPSMTSGALHAGRCPTSNLTFIELGTHSTVKPIRRTRKAGPNAGTLDNCTRLSTMRFHCHW